MTMRLKTNDPSKALEYFKSKMTFTTGPVEVNDMHEKAVSFNLIDVRDAADYTEAHAPGAINLPQESWSSFKGLSKDKLNVLYCYTPVCHLAAKAAVQFATAGYSVVEMEGGFEAWQEHGLKIEMGAPEMIRRSA